MFRWLTLLLGALVALFVVGYIAFETVTITVHFLLTEHVYPFFLWMFGFVKVLWSKVGLRLMLEWLIGHLRHFTIIEIPKKFVLGLLVITIGRPRLRRFAAYCKRLLRRAKFWRLVILRRMQGRFGSKAAWVLSVLITGGILLFGVFVVGIGYLLVPIGILNNLLGLAWNFVWVFAQRFTFRIIMFLQLARLSRWIMMNLPHRWANAYRRFRLRLLRRVLQRRNKSLGEIKKIDRSIRFRVGLWWDMVVEFVYNLRLWIKIFVERIKNGKN